MLGNVMSKSLLYLTVGLFFIFGTTPHVIGAEWLLFNEAKEFKSYYDMENLTHPIEGVTRVMTKMVITSEEGSVWFSKRREQGGLSTLGYDKYEHTLIQLDETSEKVSKSASIFF